jgi:enterochelin esterase-like enzyme
MGKLRLRSFCVVVLALLGAAALPTVGSAGQLRVDALVSSRALGGPMHALVVLPEGYRESGERYPVVYFLHGLPAGGTTYRVNAWLAGALARIGPAILALPQGARAGDPDPEYLDWGAGRNWQTYVADELPDYVDSHFRTIRSRTARALIGLSAGGYGASIVALNHLGRFSVVQSWSGYFHPTNPAGTAPIDGGPRSNVHNLLLELKRDEDRRATYLAFYVGTGDGRFRAENEQFDGELLAVGVRHRFALYPGGHDTALWQAHAPDWLADALAHLTKPGRTATTRVS